MAKQVTRSLILAGMLLGVQASAAYIQGDGSGGGGGAGKYMDNSQSYTKGGAGGGDNDTLTGTGDNDVIFGDGSGGGAGAWLNGEATPLQSEGGKGGSGNDVINGGAGDDIIFGDGFDGVNSRALTIPFAQYLGGAGGLGGGGGGGNAGAQQQIGSTSKGGVLGGKGGEYGNLPGQYYAPTNSTPTSDTPSLTGLAGTSDATNYYAGGGGGFGGGATETYFPAGYSYGRGGNAGVSSAIQGDTAVHTYTGTGVAYYDDILSLFKTSASSGQWLSPNLYGNTWEYGNGSDTLYGGPGFDILVGLGGNDTFEFRMSDIADDGSETDAIWDYSRYPSQSGTDTIKVYKSDDTTLFDKPNVWEKGSLAHNGTSWVFTPDPNGTSSRQTYIEEISQGVTRTQYIVLTGVLPPPSTIDLFTGEGGDNNTSRAAESFGEDTVAFVSGDSPIAAGGVATFEKLTVSIPTAQLDGGEWIDYIVIGDWDTYVDLAQDSVNQDYSETTVSGVTYTITSEIVGENRVVTFSAPGNSATLAEFNALLSNLYYSYWSTPFPDASKMLSVAVTDTNGLTTATPATLVVTKGIDTTAPQIEETNPADDSMGVATSPNNGYFWIYFDEAVNPVDGKTIKIYKADNTLLETFIIDTDAENVFMDDDNVAGIALGDLSLEYETEYYIQIEAGAFKDTSDNEFAGISNTTGWNFTTTQPPLGIWTAAENLVADAGEYGDLEYAPDGSAYVVHYYYDQGSGLAGVKKLVNGSWENVGGASVGLVSNYAFDLAVGSDNTPYVINSNNSGVQVYKPNDANSAWEVMGTDLWTSGSSFYDSISPDIEIHGSTLYAAYRFNDGGTRKTEIKSLDLSAPTPTWQSVGDAFTAYGSNDTFDLAIDSEGALYFATLYNYDLKFYKFDTNTNQWALLNSVTNAAIYQNNRPLDLKIFGTTPYIVHQDGANNNDVKISRFDTQTNEWTQLGGTIEYSYENNQVLDIAFDSEGTPYVATTLNGHPQVFKYDPDTSGWIEMDNTKSASVYDSRVDLEFDANDNPYLIGMNDNGEILYFKFEKTDNNTAPTDIAISNATIAENNSVGAAIGTLSTTDADQTAGHTFGLTCNGTNNGSFTIDGTTLKAAAVFDYESKNSYSICVRVTDDGNATYDENLTISITNVNESGEGVCGSADGATFVTAPTTGLCDNGISSQVSESVIAYSWSCAGTTVGNDTGPSANCSAVRANDADNDGEPDGNEGSGEVAITIGDSGSSSSAGTTIMIGYNATASGSSSSVAASLIVTPDSLPNTSEPTPEVVVQTLGSGMISIDSTSPGNNGYTQVVSFTLPQESTQLFTGYYKFGPTHANGSDHWYDFGTRSANMVDENKTGAGYEISNGGKTITLYLVDGKDGDDDLVADGNILDPGFPVLRSGSVTVPLFGPFGSVLLMLLFALLGYRKLKA